MKRRLKDIYRMDATNLKRKLDIAVKGKKHKDIDDVVRLLCLLVCCTIFFSTHGHTIGWAFIKYIEDVDAINNYAWPKRLRNSLMNSIDESNHNEFKVHMQL